MGGTDSTVAWVALNVALAALLVAASGSIGAGLPSLAAAAFIALTGLLVRK